jgi:hypothetical protein
MARYNVIVTLAFYVDLEPEPTSKTPFALPF